MCVGVHRRGGGDPVLHDLLETVRPVLDQNGDYSGPLTSLNGRDILGEIALYKGDKSYTINKREIYLCLKDKSGEYYPKNMLVYVLLHEIAHVLCDEVDHTDKFYEIFNELLARATKKGVYNDGIPMVVGYCE